MRSKSRFALVLFALGLLCSSGGHVVLAGTDVPAIFGVNEPHNVVVSPLSNQKIAVSAANAVWLSNDEGRTSFAFLNFPFPSGPAPLSYGTCGDSSLAFDLQGRLFWTILGCGTDAGGNPDVGVFVARINFDAGTIDAGFPVCAACGNNNNRDKQWIAVDANPLSPFQGFVYLVFTDLGSGNRIQFQRSTAASAGLAWSAPAAVSNVKGECANDARFPHVATDPEGNLYIAWNAYCGARGGANSGVINLVRSPDSGSDIIGGTFNAPVQVFLPGGAEITWNLQDEPCPVPGSKSLWAGSLQPFILPDPNRPGNVYVVAADDPNNDYCTAGLNDPSDVVLARSTDYGNTWTRSTVSHGPVGTFQVFPTGAIDQQGNMFVTWYDNREGNTNAGGDFLLDRYATVSRDGGQTWSFDFRINDAHFDPDLAAGCFGNPCAVPNTLRIGEYNGAAAANGIGYVSFTGNGTCSGPSNCQVILVDVFSILGQFPDAYEPNDSRQPGVPTNLGAPDSIFLDALTIHTVLDEDFFRVIAHNTGKLTFTMRSDSRASDLDIQAQDSAGNVIKTSTAGLDNNDTEQIVIPAVAGQVYYLRVFAQAGQPNPPENHYSLSVVNTPAPVPFGLALAPGSDSGRNAFDNVTNVNTPTIVLYADTSALSGVPFSPETDLFLGDDAPGYKVAVYVNGGASPAAFATPTGPSRPDEFHVTLPALPDGLDSIGARVLMIDPAQVPGTGAPSATLAITVDTAAPATPAAPDLLASSDTAGISDDNVTTVQTPQFTGAGEANALIRLYANGSQVGADLVTSGGTYQVLSSALNDGVYMMTVRLEDLAGNVSLPSAPLKVTIAKQSLTLPGATTSPAAGAATIDLGAGTVAGFASPSATGKFGIVGIPVVNIDANGHALSILGTSGDDQLTYTPTGAHAGTVSVGATGQVLNVTGVGGTFTIDPLGGGNDVVTVVGGAGDDTVTGTIDVTDTVQVGALLAVAVPNADVDRLAIVTQAGQDSITLSVTDAVNATVSVDAGDPATAQNKNGDMLEVDAGSPKGFVQNSPGGPTEGSGTILVTYPKTTNTTTRIDYTGVEKLKLSK